MKQTVQRNVTRRDFLGACMTGASVLATGSAAAGAARAAEAPGKPLDRARDKPNIIYILADDLGYGDLGCYGQKRIKTPVLDRMAAEGMKFTDSYSGSTVCAPSRCVLMTGLHTGHCFIRGNGKDNLRPGDVTVAEMLKRGGYSTALIGKWGLGHEGSAGVPTRQGFDYFFGYMDQHHAHNYYPTFLLRNETRVKLANLVPNEGKYGQGVATKKVQYSHNLLAEEALKFIERSKDGPFFLYLALTIPHANNEARNKGMEVPDYGIYSDTDWPEPQKGHAAMISLMDRDIGRLLGKLKALGLDERTLVVFTSDNGPHHEGGSNPVFSNSSGKLKGTKRSLTEGGIRVPKIAYWPGTVKPATVTAHPTCFQDLMPTACELAGVAPPKGIDGISYVPTLLGRSDQKTHEYLYWEFHEGGASKRAVRFGKWKAILPKPSGTIEIYDLSKDIHEDNNLAAERPDLVRTAGGYIKAGRTESARWPLREKGKSRKTGGKGPRKPKGGK